MKVELTEQEAQLTINALNHVAKDPQVGGLETARMLLPIADKIVAAASDPKKTKPKPE